MTKIIKGRGKGGSNKTRTPVEAPDSIQSVARAKVLIALGEGEFAGGLDGKNIFLGDSSSYTPLQNADGSYNFNNVKYEFRSGTQDQDYIHGFPGIENELQVSYELKQSVPYVRAVSNTQLSALRIRLGWPTLLLQKNNGDKVGTRVEYAIDLSVDGGPYDTVVKGAVDDKTTSLYERSHRINLPKASTGWQLRVRRITPDSTSVNIVDTMRVVAVTEIIDAKLRYVNTALLYVEFDAKQFPNGIPQVICNPKGRIIRVPDTYDPQTRAYSGTWEGVFKWAWTDNPAWIYYDIILNERFGLGQRIDATQIDKWELYRIAQYCDQLVPDGKGGSGTEPRFRCNVYIQDRNDAWTVLRDLAGIFRGMTYWGDNKMYVLADMPRDVWHIYNHASVVEGKFTFADPSETTRNTAVLVNWSDPANHYKDTPEPVYDNDLAMRFDYRQLEMTAIGCTRQSEANRRGRWALLTNGFGEVVTFSTGMDVPPVGEVIGVAANELAGRTIGGRVSAVNGRNITLDRAADVKAGNRLFLNLPSGVAQARTVQAVNGNTVTVTTSYSETPEAECNWGVDSDDLFIALFRVTGTRDNNDGSFEVTGTTYNPDIYPVVDTGARLDERPISVVPPGVQAPPDNIVVDSYSTVNQNIAITTVRVAWDAVQGAVAYEAEWRRDSGNWVSVPRTSSLGFEVQGIYSGRYLVRVRAVNASDVSSIWAASAEVTLTGKVGNPPKPVGFTASDDVVLGIELNWDFPANTDDTLKTEIQYSLTGSDGDAILLADVPYPQKRYQQMGLKAGQIFWYRAQLVDRTGNESGYINWVRGQSSTDVSDITDAVFEQIKETDLFKDMVESAIDTNDTVTGLVQAVKDNADDLAEAVKANKTTTDKLIADAETMAGDILSQSDSIAAAAAATRQTAESIIHNSLSIADVVTRQSAQNGSNSAKFEQLREVIATETEARVSDVSRLEVRVGENADGTAKNAADITEVRQAIATETDARAQAVDELTAKTGDNAAGVQSLTQAVTSLDSSTASRFEELTARTDRAEGSIQNTAIALITNTLAHTSLSQRMSVQYGDNKAGIERTTQAIATETDARVSDVTRLEAKTSENSAGITDIRQAVATETEARVSDVSRLEVRVGENADGTAKNAADITEVRQAVVTESEARAQAVNKLSAATQAAADKADEADRKSGQNAADISSLDQVVTTLDSATASRFDEVSAQLADQSGQVGTIKGGIQNTAIALITSTLAQVNQRMTLSAQYRDSNASINRLDNAAANDREATAQALLTVQTDVNNNKASINSLSQTVSTYQQATATQINAITATVNGHTSAITTNAEAIANVNGDLNAMYSIKVAVDSNGRQYAAGMGIGVENTPSGMQSQILFLADRLAVMTQAGGTVTLPFIIQGGQAFFNDAFFRNASIEFGKITDSLKSDGFISGEKGTGWNLPKSGNAELNNVTVRGKVYATDGEFKGKVTATSGSFKGTVEATSFIGDVAVQRSYASSFTNSNAPQSQTMNYQNSGYEMVLSCQFMVAGRPVTGQTGNIVLTLNINGSSVSHTFTGSTASDTNRAGMVTAFISHAVVIPADSVKRSVVLSMSVSNIDASTFIFGRPLLTVTRNNASAFS